MPSKIDLLISDSMIYSACKVLKENTLQQELRVWAITENWYFDGEKY